MNVRKLKPDELQHHGIKGQKWGIRRFQNYDGTLINSKGNKGQYGGSGSGVNDPRAKKWNKDGKSTTGKSKGVKKRGDGLGTGPVGNSGKSRTDGDYGSWLSNQHKKKKETYMNGQIQGVNSAGEKYTIATTSYSKNKNLKKNQIGCKVTKDPRGYDSYEFEFRDAEAFANFYNSPAGKAILEDPSQTAALARLAYAKGYLEYDEDFLNSEQSSTLPFASFNNLSSEEQLDPALVDVNHEPKKVERKKLNKKEYAAEIGKNFIKSIFNTTILTNNAFEQLGGIAVNVSKLINALDKK